MAANENNQGWIKLHRRLLDNPIVQKSQYWHLWTFLLLKASHEKTEFIWNGKRVVLKPGQLLTGREELSRNIKIPPSTIEKILQYLKTEHQIEQQTTNKYRIITIKNWDLYQANEKAGQQKGQQRDNKGTTKEQQRDTYKKEEEGIRRKKKEESDDLHQIFDHWNSFKGRSIRKLNKELKEQVVSWQSHTLKDDGSIRPEHKNAIRQALKAGYSVEEVCTAISSYAKILLGLDWWWSHSWTLPEFLTRKEKDDKTAYRWWGFLPDNRPEEKYLHEAAKQKRVQQAKGPVPLDLVKEQIEKERRKTDDKKQTA